MQDYTIHSLEGETPLNFQGSLWEYVSLHFKKGSLKLTHRYYHVVCDSITDKQGHCLVCGNASPCAN